MAYFRIQLYVNALRRKASFEMLIPNDMHVEAPVEKQSSRRSS